MIWNSWKIWAIVFLLYKYTGCIRHCYSRWSGKEKGEWTLAKFCCPEGCFKHLLILRLSYKTCFLLRALPNWKKLRGDVDVFSNLKRISDTCSNPGTELTQSCKIEIFWGGFQTSPHSCGITIAWVWHTGLPDSWLALSIGLFGEPYPGFHSCPMIWKYFSGWMQHDGTWTPHPAIPKFHKLL